MLVPRSIRARVLLGSVLTILVALAVVVCTHGDGIEEARVRYVPPPR